MYRCVNAPPRCLFQYPAHHRPIVHAKESIPTRLPLSSSVFSVLQLAPVDGVIAA